MLSSGRSSGDIDDSHVENGLGPGGDCGTDDVPPRILGGGGRGRLLECSKSVQYSIDVDC